MPIHAASAPGKTVAEKPGVGGAAKQVAEHASSLARLEIELASLELKRKAGALGAGAGLGVGAALLALFALGFLFATIAAALAIVLDTWLALLLVTIGLFAIAGLLGLLALSKIKRGTPPVPEQAIAEAKLTSEALKANGSH
ncbi:MAG: phage holin family protein [Actinobacteria bacterium]|nr:phage holin family protein [Actinomycetota bacterium]